jgi:hypothetical protein
MNFQLTKSKIQMSAYGAIPHIPFLSEVSGTSSKSQIQSSKPVTDEQLFLNLVFETWSLFGAWRLEIGA